MEWSINWTSFRNKNKPERGGIDNWRCSVAFACRQNGVGPCRRSIPVLYSIQTWFSLVSRLSLSSLNRLTLVTKAEPLLMRVEIKPEWPALPIANYVSPLPSQLFQKQFGYFHHVCWVQSSITVSKRFSINIKFISIYLWLSALTYSVVMEPQCKMQYDNLMLVYVFSHFFVWSNTDLGEMFMPTTYRYWWFTICSREVIQMNGRSSRRKGGYSC